MLTLHLRVVLFVLNPLNTPPGAEQSTCSPTPSVQSLLCSNDCVSHLYQASLITLWLFMDFCRLGGFQQVADGGGDGATLKEERAALRGGA